VDTRKCYLWLRTASDDPLDPTSQWLRRKLDTCDANLAIPLSGLVARAIESQNPSVAQSQSPLSDPAVIVYEVTRSFGNTAVSNKMASNWQSEMPRLLETVKAIPPGSRHVPALILVFWVPRHFDPTEFQSQTKAAITDSMDSDDIAQRVGPWRILTFSNAASADSQFEDCVTSLEFDVKCPVSLSIEDVIDPFLTAWGEALDLGMSKIVRDKQVSPKRFSILFDHMIKTLNELVRIAWNVCFGAPPDVTLDLPLLGHGLGSRNTTELYASLLDYFQRPPLEAYPVVESFKAELRHHAYYLPDVLLRHILRSLGDAVVLEVLLNAEMSDDASVGQTKTVDPGAEVRKFKTDLKSRIEQIAGVSELELEDRRSTEQSDNRRKRALEDPEPGLTNLGHPDVKRSRPEVGRSRAPVTAMALLKTVREARARHFPAMVGVGGETAHGVVNDH